MNQIIRSFDAHHVDLHPVPAAIHPRWNQQRQSHVTKNAILKAQKIVKKTRRVLTPFIQVGVTLQTPARTGLPAVFSLYSFPCQTVANPNFKSPTGRHLRTLNAAP